MTALAEATTVTAVADPVPADVRSVRRSGVSSVIGVLLVTALVAWIVPMAFGARWVSTWTATVVFAMAAASVGFLHCRLGLASLAQVALVGVGGWIALRLEFALGMPFLVTVAVTVVLTGAVGGVLSVPALRLRGLYLMLLTLMMAAGFSEMVTAKGFPNGGSGFFGYQPSGQLRRMSRPAIAQSDGAYFRLVLICAVIAFVVVLLHMRRRPGRAWSLMAQSEQAAVSNGVAIVPHKVWGFVLAASLCGLSGALFAGQLGQLGPSSFDPLDSLLLLAFVLVAGSHHWTGWLLAACLFRAFPAFLDDRGISGNVAIMIAGVALVANLTIAPRGIVGDVERIVTRLRSAGRRS